LHKIGRKITVGNFSGFALKLKLDLFSTIHQLVKGHPITIG
jgi:hypothetical protein